jgi:hypothetical protein
VKAVLVVVVALAVAPAAHAKGCARITAPATGVVGQPAAITLVTVMESDGSERLTPYVDRIVALSVYAQSYSGRVWTFRLKRDRADGSRWIGRIAFPHAGVWWLRSTASSGRPARCSGKTRVLVRRA